MVQLIIWGIVIFGIMIMKKIEPHNRIYPIYAVLVGVLLTLSTCLS